MYDARMVPEIAWLRAISEHSIQSLRAALRRLQQLAPRTASAEMEDSIEAEIRCVEAELAAAEAVSRHLATPGLSVQPLTRAGAQRLAAAVEALTKDDAVASASLADVIAVIRAAKVAQDVIRATIGQ
jgi:hypothetical protein